MNAIVTGASGHIGNCLVREIIKRGDTVRVLVHNFENDLAGLKVDMVKGNILDPGSLARLCTGADVVFHLAASIAIDNRNPRLLYSTNVTGTENMVKAAISAGANRFIHFSSIEAFASDQPGKELNENRPLTESKHNYYGYTKALGEKIVTEAVKNGLDAVIISPTAVIGPFDCKKSFSGQALLRLYRNNIPFLVKGGFNWVDVRDVAKAAIYAADNGKSGNKYILAGNYCSISELSQLVSKISDRRSRSRYIPIHVAKMAAPIISFYSCLAKNTPLYTCQSLELLVNSPKNISCRKAAAELGYAPRPIEETLRDTFDWYKENNYL